MMSDMETKNILKNDDNSQPDYSINASTHL